MRTPKTPKPRPIILCPGCHELKPLSTHGMCKACYMKSWRAVTKKAKQASVRPQYGLGKCQCGQLATTRMFLRFGDFMAGAKNGEFYNLCDRCAALEKEQEKWIA